MSVMQNKSQTIPPYLFHIYLQNSFRESFSLTDMNCSFPSCPLEISQTATYILLVNCSKKLAMFRAIWRADFPQVLSKPHRQKKFNGVEREWKEKRQKSSNMKVANSQDFIPNMHAVLAEDHLSISFIRKSRNFIKQQQC